jgi:DnaJ-class molecular chaperone
MNDQQCVFCHGTGRRASPMTNWDSVACDRCDGTGKASPLYRAGEHTSRQMIAQIDAYVDGHSETFPGHVQAIGR